MWLQCRSEKPTGGQRGGGVEEARRGLTSAMLLCPCLAKKSRNLEPASPDSELLSHMRASSGFMARKVEEWPALKMVWASSLRAAGTSALTTFWQLEKRVAISE